MIESWMDMCESEAIGEDPFVHRACWLSFGTLVHKVCSHKTFDARVAWNASKPSENEENGGGSGKGGNGVSWRRSTRALKPNKPMNGETDEPENLRCPPEVRQKVIEVTNHDSIPSNQMEYKQLLPHSWVYSQQKKKKSVSWAQNVRG